MVHNDMPAVDPAKIRLAHDRAIRTMKNAGITPNKDNIAANYKLIMRHQLAEHIPSYRDPIVMDESGKQYFWDKNSPHPEVFEKLKADDPFLTTFEKDYPNLIKSLEKNEELFALHSRPVEEWGYSTSGKTAQDVALLHSYATSDKIDDVLNSALRSSKGNMSKFHHDFAENLNAVILKNKFPIGTQVRRGTYDYDVHLLDPKTFQPTGVVKRKSELVVGDVFKDEGFLSTSLNVNNSFGSSEASELISVPGGGLQSYAYVNSLSSSPFLNEFEALLPKGLIRRVDEVMEPVENKYLKNARFKTSILNPYDKGGIVKDNHGYWNPNNWGKVVEIDSNNITMRGVDQPLIGVSDTGDTKLMQPGKDYKFKGKKVKEYPVAQEGIIKPRFTYQDSLNLYNQSRAILEAQRYNDILFRNKGYNIPSNVTTSFENIPTRGEHNFLTYLELPPYSFYKDPSTGAKLTNVGKSVTKSEYSKKHKSGIQPTGWFSKGKDAVHRYPMYPKPVGSKSKPTSKTETKKEQPKPVETPTPVQTKKVLTDYNQGTPIYAPTPHSPGAGAFVGYRTPQGDTVFVKPEDYDRMAVPKYGREYIESQKNKQRNGGVSVNRADEYPLEKLDNLFNFTNYNKPKAKSGKWLDKYK